MIKSELLKFLKSTGINDVVIWVSWWIDSALDLAIASQVVSPEHIHAIYMPTKFNSNESYELSQRLADNLWVELKVWPIQDILKTFEDFSQKYLWETLQWISHENVQARIRWIVLMNIANNKRGLVINNSNKTELELWYGTLYWDLIWGLCMIWDLKKTEVYDLSRHINKDKEIIPQWIIDRKASAELSEWQVDPFDYDRDCEAVDELAFGWDVKTVANKYGLDEEYAQSLKNRIERSRFKVAQIPPIVKISDHPLK
jgi:NAD+ synthetase